MTTALFLFTGIFCLVYLLLMLIYWMAWKRIADVSDDDSVKHFTTSITVIIAARNEADNLPSLLSCLASQDYPSSLFEVIIVDDHSEDDTARIVAEWRATNVKLIKLSDHLGTAINAYKKKAISTGIATASGELIVTTDADCTMGIHWLSSIAAYYEKHRPNMIVMPVVMKAENNGMGIFQLLDFMSLQGITGASVQLGVHGMCNGANLAYTRNTFNEVNGFENIDSIASGDDLLLMHKVKKKFQHGIHYLKSADVIVKTLAQPDFKQFLNQRIRWAGKAGHYPDKSMLPVLLWVYLFNLLLLVDFIFVLLRGRSIHLLSLTIDPWQGWLGLMLVKTFFELIFLWPVAGFFNKRKYMLVFPFFQPVHIIYTVMAGALGVMKDYEWKGRTVK